MLSLALWTPSVFSTNEPSVTKATLLLVQVSDLTGSFRLFRKPVLEHLMRLVKSKVMAILENSPRLLTVHGRSPLRSTGPKEAAPQARPSPGCKLARSCAVSLQGQHCVDGGNSLPPVEAWKLECQVHAQALLNLNCC